MAAGFQVFDGQGRLVLDLSDRLSRIIGSAGLGTGGGFIADSRLGTGTPFFQFVDVNFQFEGELPQVTLNASGISWSYIGAYTKIPVTIVYGVY